ncbi:MAG: MFS transporter [Candidatus Nanopelagicales bacterium]
MSARRSIQVDLSPLRRYPQFRYLFAGGFITSLGSMFTYVAIPFQVAELTDSFLAVGLIGVAELVPLIVFGLYGGSLADRIDKRRMVLAGEAAALVLALALLANSLLASPQVAVIYVVSMLFAAVDGLQRPSIDAILPRVVPHDDLSAAGALNSTYRSISAIAGPAIGGLVLAGWGPAAAYGIDALSFVASIVVLARLKPVPPVMTQAAQRSVRHIADGMRYAWSRKDIMGTYAVDLAAMTFAFPFALFPFIAQEFDAPWALGFLYAAGFVGALVFGLTSGWTPRIRHHGRAVAVAAVCWGAAVGLAGLAPSIGWILVLLAIAGYFDMLSGHFRQLMWNQSIPDDVRGRMAGIEMLSYSIGPLLGQVRSTSVAQLTSLRTSLITGGIACVAAVGIACAAFPAMWRYDARTDAHTRQRRQMDADGTSETS